MFTNKLYGLGKDFSGPHAADSESEPKGTKKRRKKQTDSKVLQCFCSAS
jgi:hypothetical protein